MIDNNVSKEINSNKEYKINLTELYLSENINYKKKFFGNWIDNIDNLKQQFLDALPFEHIIIPNFLNNDYAEQVFNEFPDKVDNDSWHQYYNPIEIKYAYDDIKNMSKNIKQYFYLLSTQEITNIFSSLSNIDDLEYDPYLHGAGLHAHPKNGRLHVHLDYEKHPYLCKERRLNIILYMSKDWKEEWNGQTELWDKNMEKCVVKSSVNYNTAIIFKTNEQSWHGIPDPIQCPENVLRKSIAYYYISPLSSKANNNINGNDGTGYRTKAFFTKRPEDLYCEKMDKLYKIRPHRLITNNDLEQIYGKEPWF